MSSIVSVSSTSIQYLSPHFLNFPTLNLLSHLVPFQLHLCHVQELETLEGLWSGNGIWSWNGILRRNRRHLGESKLHVLTAKVIRIDMYNKREVKQEELSLLLLHDTS